MKRQFELPQLNANAQAPATQAPVYNPAQNAVQMGVETGMPNGSLPKAEVWMNVGQIIDGKLVKGFNGIPVDTAKPPRTSDPQALAQFEYIQQVAAQMQAGQYLQTPFVVYLYKVAPRKPTDPTAMASLQEQFKTAAEKLPAIAPKE